MDAQDAATAVEQRLRELALCGGITTTRPSDKRVVHCIGSLGPGGAERQLCNVAVASASRGWHVRVLTTSDLTGVNAHYLPLLDQAGIVARRAGSAFHPTLRETVLRASDDLLQVPELPAFLLPYAVDFAVEMLAEPPDIVHAWLDLTNIWAGVAAMLTGVPDIILSLRNMSPPRFPYLYQDWFKPWYSLLAASPRVRFVNNSAAGARDYAAWLGLPPERIQVITNGVDFDSVPIPAPGAVAAVRNELAPGGGRLLIGVFRLSAEKQPMLFFEVARRALATFDDLTVVVVGNGALKGELEGAIAAHGLEARFRVLAHRRDIHTLIAASDVLLMTSRYEGTPNVVLEAQRLGRPVVGTRSGGTTEAIEDCHTGYLLNVDDADGLAGAVNELLANGELRARMGAAGPDFVAAKFGLERMTDETLAVYEAATSAAAAAFKNETRAPRAAGRAASGAQDAARLTTRLRAGLKRGYMLAQRYPTTARVADRLRQSAWLHGDLAVPREFRQAIRTRSNSLIELFAAPQRVTHYIGGLGAGGSERQLCNLVVASQARGIATRVRTAVDPIGANGHYAEYLHAAGISVVRAGARCHPLLRQTVANLPTLRLLDPCPPFLHPYMLDMLSELMINPPHVLHCWLDLTNIWAGVAGLIADVPAIVLSTRSVNPSNFPGIHNPWFKNWYQALAESPRVHFINNSTAGALDYAQWLGLPSSRFEVIRNGVDLSAIQRPTPEDRHEVRRELGLDQDAPVLIGVLRMTEEKQPMLFFAAGLEVIRRVPDAHVLLVGTGPFERQLTEAIAAQGVQARFHLLGQRRDVYRLMAASDLLLLTSRLEGTPNVLLEAQWVGCAVATTPAGGAVDALADGITGIVVDGSVPARLGDQVVDLMQDRPRLEAMGRAGPVFVADKFSVGRMVDETLALYQRALHPATGGEYDARNDRNQGD